MVDRLLDELPEDLMEARRLISSVLWSDPRPEELQVIVQIATDPTTAGPRRDLPRHLIALRSRVESALAVSRNLTTLTTTLTPETVGEIAETLRLLASASNAFDNVMAAASESESSGNASDREYLANARKTLAPPKGQLAAAAFLSSMLVRLADAVHNEEIPGAFEDLNPEETAMLMRFSPRGDEPPRPFDRDGLDACCLRLMIHEDLKAWSTLPDEEPGDTAENPRREALSRRFRIHLATYRDLSDRIQALQDSAISARQSEVAERLGGIRRLLFATYQRLTGSVRNVQAPEEQTSRPRERERAPQPLSHRPKTESRRERVLREALAGAVEGDDIPAPSGSLIDGAKQVSLWKLNVALLVIVALLGVFRLFGTGPPPRIETTPEDYLGVLTVTEVEALGTTLYARTEPSWVKAPEAERLRQLQGLGRTAEAKGFRSVYLVDPSGVAIGVWDVGEGARLPDPPAESSVGNPRGPGS
jgi:hypothetical protein